MKTFDLIYELEGAGWATLQVKCGQKEYTYAASYLHDSLHDLSKKTLKLLQSDVKEQNVVFIQEPGELQLELKKLDTGLLSVRAKSFDQMIFGRDDTARFTVDFTCETELRTFGKIILRNLQAIYQEFGMKGYKEKWKKHEFPEMNYFELKNLLDAGENKKSIKGH